MRYDFGAALAGLAFVAIGITFLLDALDVAEFRFEVLLPLLAIAVGVAAIISAATRSREA